MEKLAELRKEIDEVNNSLIDTLTKRKAIVLSIAKIKKENNIAVFDKKREQDLLVKIQEISAKKGLNPEFVKKVFELILENSKEEQDEFIK